MADNAVENAVQDTGKNLGKKVGGLPVWAWAGILVGGGFVTYILFFRGGSETPTRTTFPASGPSFGGGGSGGGGSSGGTSPGEPAAVLQKTNTQWLEDAVARVQKASGMNAAQIRTYLEQFLRGRRPVGSAAAISDFDRVIRLARESIGEPPNIPVLASDVNPFSNNITWLQSALAFIPGGTPANIRQELIDLFNGVSSNISPATASLIDQLRNVQGSEPEPLSFTIRQPGVTPVPSKAPTLPNLAFLPALVNSSLAALRTRPDYVGAQAGPNAGEAVRVLEAGEIARLTGLPLQFARQVIDELRMNRRSTDIQIQEAISKAYVSSGMYQSPIRTAQAA